MASQNTCIQGHGAKIMHWTFCRSRRALGQRVLDVGCQEEVLSMWTHLLVQQTFALVHLVQHRHNTKFT